MAKHVVVPVDGSEQSDEAVRYVADEYPGAEVTLIHVIDPIEAGYSAQATVPGYSEEWYEQSEEAAEDLFEEARQEFESQSVDTVTELGRPARTIVEYAEDEDHDVDLIVMGSHGRSGVSRVLLGSVAETVVRRSPVPVLVVR
ncbi:MAG: universal stress protein [Halobacteriaceae archaeon]